MLFIPQLHFTSISFIHHSFHGNTWAQQIDLLNLSGIIAQLVKALHQYRRGHGFESIVNTWNFSGAHMRQLLKLSSTCEDHFFNSSFNHCSQTFLSFKTIHIALNLLKFALPMSWRGYIVYIGIFSPKTREVFRYKIDWKVTLPFSLWWSKL